MDIRNQKGFSAAEGCMFAAVGLFAILLIVLVYIAALRFRDRPTQDEIRRPGAAVEVVDGGARV